MKNLKKKKKQYSVKRKELIFKTVREILSIVFFLFNEKINLKFSSL